jgi:uncharacterized membrane protein
VSSYPPATCPRTTAWLSGLIIIVMLAVSAGAQNYNPFNQRDDQYRLLGLKRAKQAYETARVDFGRKQELYNRGLINQHDLDLARNVFTDAEVNYQQSLLAVLFEEQYITVTSAVKYQAKDDSKHVRLTLSNTSGGSAEFRKLIEMEDELFRSLQPDVIPNVYVSVLNDNLAVISQPYEAKIDELRFGEPQTLDFKLLQDLDVVTVYVIYANGAQRQMKIFLQKDNSVNKVVVQSEQFSQEVELGQSSSFDLSLELFSGAANTFSLEVLNLPPQIGRYFSDPGSSVRLNQVKFTESAHSKRAALQVTMPDRPTDQVVMDKPVSFYVLVLPRDRATAISDLHTRQWTETDIAALQVGYVRLEVLPRGIGRLRATSTQLYFSIDAGKSAEMDLELSNEGSHRIDNVEVKADLPHGWSREITPESVPSLAIGREARVRLVFTPPDNVAPGKYEVRLRSSGQSNGRPILGEDKTVSIEVRSEAGIVGAAVIVLLLLGLVVGIVVFGIRLSRR